ncbi:reverse transcriptase domain-containing protein [Listeria sp. ILCC792]|uniref:reverse transcriptase domain-containing protein n=1 Tax=Listeria sp. ILCC792 TaxID=1918331 RepID=UPI001356473C|nr:reverse transcriptase domain-containing protein [Listeria sp. ILCC792]
MQQIQLKEIDEVLVLKFRNLNNFKEVADLLEISPQFLRDILYEKRKYSHFYISKKNGGEREIFSPVNNLKIIQKKLAYIFTLDYTPFKSSFGFVKKKSIIDNAALHTNKKWVFNFDLKDFFHQFNQGRVIGLFRRYFNFNNVVAGVLAEICCHQNILPQGAPTSPILSNMLCFEVDRELQKLCSSKQCTYSRYVDDITISSSKDYFPRLFAFKDGEGRMRLGRLLEEILRKTGFDVNQEKIYLRTPNQNQNVTGLTVNEIVNVNRNYVKRIRASIHNLKVNTEEAAREKFFIEYTKRKAHINPNANVYSILKGQIQFVAQVKGRENPVFKKLASQFNSLNLPSNINPISPLTRVEKFRRRNCFIVEISFEREGEFFCNTGSAFYLKKIGLVSAAHIFKDYFEHYDSAVKREIYIVNEVDRKHKIKINKKYIDYDLDIAIFNLDTTIDTMNWGFNRSDTIYENQKCILLGYPEDCNGNTLNTEFGKITQVISNSFPNKFNSIEQELGLTQIRYKISATIYGGNSGGPILDIHENVIGIAAKGTSDNGITINTFVPISDIKFLMNS